MNTHLFRRNSVLESLRANRRRMVRLLVQGDLPLKRFSEIINAARQGDVPVERADKATLTSLSGSRSHQGVVLECGDYPYCDIEEIVQMARDKGEPALIVVFDQVQGTRNVGQLLRTAEICGVHGVVMQERHAPEITAELVIDSSGASEHLLIAQVTNISESMRRLKESGIWIAGLDATPEAISIEEADLTAPLALVVGNEGSGLRRLVASNCDYLVQLPMRGQVESLNASVAGSIAIYSAWQRRGFPGTRAPDEEAVH